MDEPPIVLLGCVKQKRDAPSAAAELYRSPLWRARRRYAEARAMPWFILSALHGLVEPSRILAPYDLSLNDLSAGERRRWGERVVVDLDAAVNGLGGRELEVHAGGYYVRAISDPARDRGATVVAPLARVRGVGSQIGWYAQNT